MIPRLLLVGGPGGAGSSTWAARFADSWAEDRDQRVAVAAMDPAFGASRLVTHPRCTGVQPSAQLPAAVRSAARSWRVDPFVAEQLISRLDGFPLLWQLPDLLERFDRVVVDAGAALSRLLLTSHLLPWVLAEAGPLNGGWLRATRPVTALALGGSGMAKAGAQQLAAVNQRADELSQLVISAETAVVLATNAPTVKLRHAAAAVTLAQARLGATVGPGVAAAGSPLAGTPHWDALPERWDGLLADRARDVEITGSARDGDVLWRVPLPFNSSDELTLEQSGLRLVVGVHEHRRTFVLPSLLSRHVAESANLRHGILEVSFRPETS